MGRNATLRIENQTGYTLTYVSHDVMHGKFQDHWSPPQSIADGATGVFKVGNKTGAKIGPKGTVTYSLEYAHGITVHLIFFWDHPFSASSSSYYVNSDPVWFGAFYLNPPNPEGHDQDVTYVTRLNDYGFDPKTWMATISAGSTEDILLRSLFIPGSHDSASYDIKYMSSITVDYESKWIPVLSNLGLTQGWSKAQANSILDQLNAGIRYFDLRVSNGCYVTSPTANQKIITIGPDDPIPMIPGDPPQPVSNVVRESTLYICHSLTSVQPETVFNDIKTFIDAHPGEIVILNFQHLFNMNTDEYTNLFTSMKNIIGEDKLIPRQESFADLTLKKLLESGQIITIIESDHIVTTSAHPNDDKQEFMSRYADLYDNNSFIWGGSDFLNNPWPNTSDLDDLHTKLTTEISTYSPDLDKLFVLQGIISPDTSMYMHAASGTYPKSLEELGNEVSPQVTSWVNNEWYGDSLNIIMLDWVKNSVVTQICYMLNKHYKG